MNLNVLLIVFVSLLIFNCNSSKTNIKFDNIQSKGLEMAIRMADSEMVQFPESWAVDFNTSPKWNYTPGLVSTAMIELWEKTDSIKYYEYAKGYADTFIDEEGNILGYVLQDYNIDKINSGKFLFDIYKQTGDLRYKKSIDLLRSQMETHPRTSEGGFWHKNRYPHQMWLDGLYMGPPFLAQYATEFNEPELFDDIVNQFVTVHKHTYDISTGLNYHAWDESKEQKWSDPVTGCSPHFWGRAMGWYAMALVDVLDFIPNNHPGRQDILKILKNVAKGIARYQDKDSGLWYQVLDQGGREGNYFESSVSTMFVYALLKASRKGYIDEEYKEVALEGYKGILNQFIRENENGTISLTLTCAVAGLGGDPYRDGSFEYYVGEPVRDNDPKGVGPFILASLEINEL